MKIISSYIFVILIALANWACAVDAPNLKIFQDMVIEIITENNIAVGVTTEAGNTIYANAIILASGTFLNGLAHIGMNSFTCGRTGERASIGLSESELNELKLQKLVLAKEVETISFKLAQMYVHYDNLHFEIIKNKTNSSMQNGNSRNGD